MNIFKGQNLLDFADRFNFDWNLEEQRKRAKNFTFATQKK